MTRVLFGSDLHLGHKRIHHYRKWIDTAEQNYEFVADNWCATSRDIVYLLGDIIFGEKDFEFLRKLPARSKRLVMGNHDWERFKASLTDIHSTFDEVHGLTSYKKSWLSHAPMEINELYRKKFNIHGHDHTGRFDYARDPRYFNVNTDILYRDYGVMLMDYQRIQSMALPRVEAFEARLNSPLGKWRTGISEFFRVKP